MRITTVCAPIHAFSDWFGALVYRDNPNWSRDGKYIYFSSSRDNDLSRVRISERKIERLASLKDFRIAVGVWGPWPGWAPDGSPLVLRDVGAQDIYALEWQTP
jgi:Tol biopolymer transport system component